MAVTEQFKNQCRVRCGDCPYFDEKKVTCSECFDNSIFEIDDCPEGVQLGEIEKIEEHAKENKVKVVARAEDKKERKPRERKADPEKENLIKEFFDMLNGLKDVKNVEITNISKNITFEIGENHYKIDLIRQRTQKSSQNARKSPRKRGKTSKNDEKLNKNITFSSF